jgi:secondary thiamine-phosphate synthase enzyme
MVELRKRIATPAPHCIDPAGGKPGPMPWHRRTIRLKARRRGFHLITEEVVAALPELREIDTGVCHLLLQHSSASLSINESYDPDVRRDMAGWADRHAPENEPWYIHTCEGPDDMPAHIKCALFGVSLSIPLWEGRFALGTWQGLWLGEHRDRGGERRIAASIQGA